MGLHQHCLPRSLPPLLVLDPLHRFVFLYCAQPVFHLGDNENSQDPLQEMHPRPEMRTHLEGPELLEITVLPPPPVFSLTWKVWG